jgi:hypothetical protein
VSDIVEHLAATIHPIRLDPQDNDASVARWFVEAAIDEIESLRTLLADATRKLEEARKIILVIRCCETVQRLQTNSVNPRDYWQVKMKGISDPYFIGKDDLPALLKQIHEDLFIDQAIEQGKGGDDA